MVRTTEFTKDDHVKLVSLVDFLKTTESVLFINSMTSKNIKSWVAWLEDLNTRFYDARDS